MSYSDEELKRIYLQISPYGDEEPSGYEITWCVDRINPTDVEYVRRDVAAGLYKAINWLSAQEGRKLTEHEAFELGAYLNSLVWLADSPEAPLSPDGESGEESET